MSVEIEDRLENEVGVPLELEEPPVAETPKGLKNPKVQRFGLLRILFLLPLFVIFVNLGQVTGLNLYGSRTGLIITYMTFTLPFAIWMLAAYLDTIPRDLDDAAKVDGSGPMGAFIRVVIPAAVPGIVAVLIYAFMTSWSEMLFASVLTNDSTRTLAVGLQGYATQNQVYWNQVMAASLTVSVPIVVGFLLLQRFLVAGMTAGSVK